MHECRDADRFCREDAPITAIAPDELLLIKYCDRASAPARFAPHTAFLHQVVAGDESPRESISVHAPIFHGQGWGE